MVEALLINIDTDIIFKMILLLATETDIKMKYNYLGQAGEAASGSQVYVNKIWYS